MISLLSYTDNAGEKRQNPLKNPVEKIPRNYRFLSLVVVERVLIATWRKPALWDFRDKDFTFQISGGMAFAAEHVAQYQHIKTSGIIVRDVPCKAGPIRSRFQTQCMCLLDACLGCIQMSLDTYQNPLLLQSNKDHLGETHPTKPLTRIKAQCAQIISERCVQTLPFFKSKQKTSRERLRKLFLQTVLGEFGGGLLSPEAGSVKRHLSRRHLP